MHNCTTVFAVASPTLHMAKSDAVSSLRTRFGDHTIARLLDVILFVFEFSLTIFSNSKIAFNNSNSWRGSIARRRHLT